MKIVYFADKKSGLVLPVKEQIAQMFEKRKRGSIHTSEADARRALSNMTEDEAIEAKPSPKK